MSSVYVICWIFLQTFQTYFCIQANNVDSDQTADLGPHCLQKWLLKSQVDDKADDNCCDWQFKGKLHDVNLSRQSGDISSVKRKVPSSMHKNERFHYHPAHLLSLICIFALQWNIL